MSNILKLSQTYNFLLIKQFLSITFFLFFMYDQLQQINYNYNNNSKTTLNTYNNEYGYTTQTKLWSHSYSTTTTTRATLKMIHSPKKKTKIFKKKKHQKCTETKKKIYSKPKPMMPFYKIHPRTDSCCYRSQNHLANRNKLSITGGQAANS